MVICITYMKIWEESLVILKVANDVIYCMKFKCNILVNIEIQGINLSNTLN